MFEYKVVGNFTLHKFFLHQNQNVTNGLNAWAQNIDQVVLLRKTIDILTAAILKTNGKNSVFTSKSSDSLRSRVFILVQS